MIGPPQPDSPKFAYYHGTTESSAVSIAANGINKPELQANDRGFFGEGFYVSQSFLHAKHYGQAVLQVKFPRSVDVFPAYELIEGGDSVLFVDDTPEWYDHFVQHHLDSVRDAAVWEDVPNATREEVVESARWRVTPGADGFNRRRVYGLVTDYAKETGFDIVEWNSHENVVVNFNAPSEFVGESDVAKAALKEAKMQGKL